MPRPLFTPGKDPVPIVQEAGWAPGLVWTGVENITPPQGFDPRTVQPVASRYTDYATRPKFYRACDISIIYCSGDGFLFVCLSELHSGNLCI